MANDINEYYYEQHFKGSRTTAPEIHNDRRCRYIARKNCQVYDADESYIIDNILILVRICFCGNFTNNVRFANRMQFRLHEIGDGLEAHFHTECRYTEKRGRSLTYYYKELTKHEYCSKLSHYL